MLILQVHKVDRGITFLTIHFMVEIADIPEPHVA